MPCAAMRSPPHRALPCLALPCLASPILHAMQYNNNSITTTLTAAAAAAGIIQLLPQTRERKFSACLQRGSGAMRWSTDMESMCEWCVCLRYLFIQED
ncbi:hypothetical protein BKA80DRAFT_280793, partial [Phyllosticta citrichinensis]